MGVYRLSPVPRNHPHPVKAAAWIAGFLLAVLFGVVVILALLIHQVQP